LYYQHLAIALIEAKDNTHTMGDGMQQALDYATILEIPFVFFSNGDGFLLHNRPGYERAVRELQAELYQDIAG
jgi:type I restriction enzyme, R subunit